ncbi:MAG: hypothetical protein ACLQHS_03280 [Candidatus Limnocylindrales bacterium]|jgi:hypothetical protein
MTTGGVAKVVSDPARWAEDHAAVKSVVHDLPAAAHHYAPGRAGSAEAGREPEAVAGGQQ